MPSLSGKLPTFLLRAAAALAKKVEHRKESQDPPDSSCAVRRDRRRLEPISHAPAWATSSTSRAGERRSPARARDQPPRRTFATARCCRPRADNLRDRGTTDDL